MFLRSGIRFPSRVWYEDLRASVKLLVAARSIVTLPDHLYRYLQRPGSTMHSGNTERCREILLAFDDLLDWFQAEGILEPYRNILCRLCVDHAYLAASVRVLLDDPTSASGRNPKLFARAFPQLPTEPLSPTITCKPQIGVPTVGAAPLPFAAASVSHKRQAHVGGRHAV